jgi:hypothetical protein
MAPNEQEILRLEEFFKTQDLKGKEYKNSFMHVHDLAVAVEVDLFSIKRDPNNFWFQGALLRLQEYKRYLLGQSATA